MSSDTRIARSPGGNLRTLGAFWVVYGIARLIMAICLFIFSGTATLMFGALLNRVPNPLCADGRFPFFLRSDDCPVGSLWDSGHPCWTGAALQAADLDAFSHSRQRFSRFAKFHWA